MGFLVNLVDWKRWYAAPVSPPLTREGQRRRKVCLGEGLGSNLRMVPHKYSTLGD